MAVIDFLKALFIRQLPKKKIIAVALGSGGAKGVAHLGALKALEEEGIEFNRFSGTSIGSIVGALKAYGYTNEQLKEVVFNICLKQYVRYLRPYMDMGFIEDFLNAYLHGASFSDLKFPFCAWATQKENMQGVALTSGLVSRACVASSAVPPYFHSVEIDNKQFIDGAYTNPLPGDVLRESGAHFVLGIDLGAQETENIEKGNRPHNILTRVISDVLDSAVNIQENTATVERGYKACHFILRLPLGRYTALDANKTALLQMYEIGYTQTKAQVPAIKAKMAEVLKNK